jgi:hypothetical protein
LFSNFGFALVDHISFRSCCHYLNDQSHQRNDIGPRSIFRITTDQSPAKFERIASLHPYSISYSGGRTNEMPLNTIWSRITSLRRLWLSYGIDTAPLLSTQTSLTWLQLRVFSPHIHHCTNLLDLTTPLRSLNDYQYLPSSLTRLNIEVEDAKDDDNFMDMIDHLPHLSSLELEIGRCAGQLVKAGRLSSLSRWSSLTQLSISDYSNELLSLDGLVHNGSLLSTNIPSSVSHLQRTIK